MARLMQKGSPPRTDAIPLWAKAIRPHRFFWGASAVWWGYHQDEKQTAEEDKQQEHGDIPVRRMRPIHFKTRLSCTIAARTM